VPNGHSKFHLARWALNKMEGWTHMQACTHARTQMVNMRFNLSSVRMMDISFRHYFGAPSGQKHWPPLTKDRT